MEIYKNFKVYGPYKSKQDNRLRVVLVNGDTKKTVSYPKYLVEIYLNRYLLENETIDHIDGNFLNNDLSNLRVIDRKEHIRDDILKLKDIEINCKWCNKLFKIKGNLINNRNRKQASGFCSKSCSGKYGKALQLGGNKLDKIKEYKAYYKQKSDTVLKSVLEEQNIGEALTSKVDGNTEA